VVHLKRFSSSRAMRDKIDTFVDFPVTDLDLGGRVGERLVAEELLAQGMDISELGLSNPDFPLIYDLFGVDEHMGGLGGGHYRAYAMNHLTDKWYHFDDSFVTPAQPAEAVVSHYVLPDMISIDETPSHSRMLMHIFCSTDGGQLNHLAVRLLRRLSRHVCSRRCSAPNSSPSP
jgi:Ubiquitin carboxyl-terminal hydrolase